VVSVVNHSHKVAEAMILAHDFPVYTGLGADVSLPKAGKMPALPGKNAHETKLFTLNRSKLDARMSVRKIRILLGDGSEVVRIGLREVLSRQDGLEVLGDTGDGRNLIS